MQPPERRPAWLRVDRLLGEWGIPQDSAAGRQEFAGRMEARRRAEGAGEYAPAGWCLGSAAFGQELLAQISEQASPQHTGADIRESGLAKAERIVREELAHLSWTEEDLRGHRKSDGRKVQMAARLRRETTMTLTWIGQRLEMGAPGHVSSLLWRRSPKESSSEKKRF